MTGPELEKLSTQFLSQLFPDTDISLRTTPGVAKTTSKSGGNLSFKLNPSDGYRVNLARERSFEESEEVLVQRFINYVLSKLSLYGNASFENVILNQFHEFIASYIDDSSPVLSRIINRYITLSDTTYEGRKISLSCVIDLDKIGKGFDYLEMLESKGGPVLSNGMDTAIVIGKNGKISGFKYCGGNSDTEQDDFVPFRYMPVACETSGRKIAVILNKNDELLIIQDKKLVFSRRRGRWQFYQSEVLFKTISFESAAPHSFVRQGVYATSLDISFARSGGCIAVIQDEKLGDFEAFLGANSATEKSFLDENIVSKYFKEVFYKEPRQVRSEICGIDGAVIIDQKGKLLYAGKIVPVTVSATVGARTAAAKTLAQFGLGIKISMDGMVEVYAVRGGTVKRVESYC